MAKAKYALTIKERHSNKFDYDYVEIRLHDSSKSGKLLARIWDLYYGRYAIDEPRKKTKPVIEVWDMEAAVDTFLNEFVEKLHDMFPRRRIGYYDLKLEWQ